MSVNLSVPVMQLNIMYLIHNHNVSKPVCSDNVIGHNVYKVSTVSKLVKPSSVSKPVYSSNASDPVICYSTCNPVFKFVRDCQLNMSINLLM